MLSYIYEPYLYIGSLYLSVGNDFEVFKIHKHEEISADLFIRTNNTLEEV